MIAGASFARRFVPLLFVSSMAGAFLIAQTLAQPADEPVKCGTSWRMVQRVRATGAGGEALTPGVQVRPVLQTSIVSPAGHFRVHFDTSGANVPALLDPTGARIPGSARAYVDSAAWAFDRSRRMIVDSMGYQEPPADSDGGDGLYDVYVMNLPFELFGETQLELLPDQVSQSARYLSWILIDNDFATQRTRGTMGAYVTAAHEYFHAIQVGSYGVRGAEEFYWYEISSSWVEEKIFPGIDDYVFDVSQYFRSYRTTSLFGQSALFPGYERAVFAHFLSERFGDAAIRAVWEQIRENSVPDAVKRALKGLGTSIEREVSVFGLWNFHTADRADPAMSYIHGAKFPRLEPILTTALLGEEVSFSYEFEPVSQGLFGVRFGLDTVYVIVVNTNVGGLVAGPGGRGTPRIVLSRTGQDRPSQSLSVGLTGGFEAVDMSVWDVEYFSSASGRVIMREDLRPFPNPWRLSSAADLFVPVTATEGVEVHVSFIAPDFRAVDGGQHAVTLEKGEPGIRIPRQDLSGRLSSGVYVVLLTIGDDQRLQKLTVIR